MFTLVGALILGSAVMISAEEKASDQWTSTKYPKKVKSVQWNSQSGWKWQPKAEPVMTQAEPVEVTPISEPEPEVVVAPVVVPLVETKLTFEETFKFKSGSDEITSYSQSEIDKLATMMTENENAKVRVEGHTDSSGAAAFNQDLSARRAQSVAKTLESHGIALDRVEAVGYGESKPIAPNNTADGRQENRRVDLYLIQE